MACNSVVGRLAGLLPRSADAGESYLFPFVVAAVGVAGAPTPPTLSTPSPPASSTPALLPPLVPTPPLPPAFFFKMYETAALNLVLHVEPVHILFFNFFY